MPQRTAIRGGKFRMWIGALGGRKHKGHRDGWPLCLNLNWLPERFLLRTANVTIILPDRFIKKAA